MFEREGCKDSSWAWGVILGNFGSCFIRCRVDCSDISSRPLNLLPCRENWNYISYVLCVLVKRKRWALWRSLTVLADSSCQWYQPEWNVGFFDGARLSWPIPQCCADSWVFMSIHEWLMSRGWVVHESMSLMTLTGIESVVAGALGHQAIFDYRRVEPIHLMYIHSWHCWEPQDSFVLKFKLTYNSELFTTSFRPVSLV